MSFKNSIKPTLGSLLYTLLFRWIGGSTPTYPTSPQIHLYTARAAPLGQGTTVANFTEATFSGYAAQSFVATGTPIVNGPQGQSVGVVGTNVFTCSAPGTSENILGYWVDDGTGSPNLMFAEDFDTPVPIVAAGDFIKLDWAIPSPWTRPF